jgi:hypothetical protein
LYDNKYCTNCIRRRFVFLDFCRNQLRYPSQYFRHYSWHLYRDSYWCQWLFEYGKLNCYSKHYCANGYYNQFASY